MFQLDAGAAALRDRLAGEGYIHLPYADVIKLAKVGTDTAVPCSSDYAGRTWSQYLCVVEHQSAGCAAGTIPSCSLRGLGEIAA